MMMFMKMMRRFRLGSEMFAVEEVIISMHQISWIVE